MTIFLAQPESPSDGIRLAVKDLFDTAGLETTYGSAIFAGHVPAATARAVELLEAAGYANVGKTNLHEFAYGTTSENPHFGAVPNPAAPGRVAGGSSGGNAAALALGLADAATRHRLRRLDPHPRRLLRDRRLQADLRARAARRLLAARAHLRPRRPDGTRRRHLYEDAGGAGPRPSSAGRSTPSRSSASASPGRSTPIPSSGSASSPPPRDSRIRRRIDVPLWDGPAHVFQREVADVHRELFAESSSAYGEDVAIKVESLPARDRRRGRGGQRERERYRERAEDACDGIDLLVTPTLPCVAPPLGAGGIGDLDVRETLIRLTLPFNTVGWPALALPCGTAEDGLPASVQLVGRPGDDALVLAAGALLYPV